MSIQAIAWVLENSASELTDRLVLLAIANHADAHGLNAWPAVDQIAREARVGRSTVFRSLQRLADLGEVKVTSGGHGPRSTNRYQILMEGSQIGTLKGSKIGTLSSEKGSQSETKGSQSETKRVPTVNHKPSFNRQEPIARARTREAPPCDQCLEGEGRLLVDTTVDPKTFAVSGGRRICQRCYDKGGRP